MPNRMDSMVSHGMGAFKSLKARLSGLVGIFRTLAEQHGEVTALLERAKVSDEKFTELWPTIRRELMSHERAEMRELYPLLREHASTRQIADTHDEEAAQLEALINEIDQLAIGSDVRRERYKVLIEKVRSHANEEERDFFPKAQQAIGKDQAQQLDSRFLAAKRQIANAV
jgi:hemerythrin superfamily protein